MRAFLTGLLLGLLVLCAAPQAQACTAPCTKAQVTTDINANWPDNVIGVITPALLRSTVSELLNSYLDVNGSSTFVCPTHQVLTAIATLSSYTCAQVSIADISGWGTGVATALGVNVGTAGAFVVNGGVLGTPSSGVATNLTGTAAGLTAGNVTTNANLTGAVTSTGNATLLGSFTSANLRGALTDETGTGVAYFQGGDIGTPSAGVGTNLTALNASNLASGTVASARLPAPFTNGLTSLTNSIPANVALNNTASYFDGPSVAQGATGIWYASGSVTLTSTAADTIICRLNDGTTTVATGAYNIAAGTNIVFALSGVLTSPAGNIRISCRDASSVNGNIVALADTITKASTINVMRLQ